MGFLEAAAAVDREQRRRVERAILDLAEHGHCVTEIQSHRDQWSSELRVELMVGQLSMATLRFRAM